MEDANEETNNEELEESNSHGDIRKIDWDEETFNVCKEKMLPLKPMLLKLKTQDELLPLQSILTIGDQVNKYISNLKDEEKFKCRNSLWPFVAWFANKGPDELHDLYKKASAECEKKGDNDEDNCAKELYPKTK